MAALDFPNAPTNGQQYTAPNGAVYTWDGTAWTVTGVLSTGTAAGGDLGGTYPNPTVVKASGDFALPAAGKAIEAGAFLPKARFYSHPTTGKATYASLNAKFSTGLAYTQDDAATPSWVTKLDAALDVFEVLRIPAGSTTPTSLLLLDNVGQLTLPANTAGGAAVKAGSRAQKVRLLALNALDFGALALNQAWTGSAWVRDDAAALAWRLVLHGGSDYVACERISAAGAATTPLIIYGDGNFAIAGAVGQKSTGTTWANPSDPRLKRAVVPYTTGLDALTQLQPIAFKFNGQGGTTDDDRQCWGFDASVVQTVMPECVTTRLAKLGPTDDVETELLVLDQSNMILALVNGVRELASRVAALEAA